VLVRQVVDDEEVECDEEAEHQQAGDRVGDPAESCLGLRVCGLGRLDALGAELSFLAEPLVAFDLGVDLCIGTGDSRHQLPPKEQGFAIGNLGFYRGFLSIILVFLAKIDLYLKTL
jgi:hypothetical protein